CPALPRSLSECAAAASAAHCGGSLPSGWRRACFAPFTQDYVGTRWGTSPTAASDIATPPPPHPRASRGLRRAPRPSPRRAPPSRLAPEEPASHRVRACYEQVKDRLAPIEDVKPGIARFAGSVKPAINLRIERVEYVGEDDGRSATFHGVYYVKDKAGISEAA